MIINNMSTLSTTTYSKLTANPLISKASITGISFEVYTTPTNHLPHTYQVMISIISQDHSWYEVKKLVTLPLDTNTTNNKIDNLVKETLGNLLTLKANMVL